MSERTSLVAALDRIESALQRVMPGMNWLEWVADDGEPAMEALAIVRASAFKDAMGDDGTGHCRGCGQPIERFDPDCAVCMAALDAIHEAAE